ncbi:transcriptional regulator [Corynebacterium uterequi]|uniref:Winged helix DNA-binding domain n=1 Tax=Corynebacterium uterequi TaxID=1072256 RepID=A0A0G3HC21_9CORY|nr:transcriptional regulator [Corynebacterium uterequi]AKK10941.1 Winged helix DNA-binding domain [Corynebacterium uterequi]
MAELDPVIHPIVRLKICAVLAAAGATQGEVNKEMRFSHLKKTLGVSDATLSKQLGYLEKAGYVTRQREWGSTRAKDQVWVTLTASGLQAFEGHRAALREIAGLEGSEPAQP